MKRTQRLLTTNDAAIFPAPDHLSVRAKQLWRELAPTQARSIQRRTLLQAALEALDRADQARQLIAKEGVVSTTATTGALHGHPAVKIEREARAQFVKIWDMLHFVWSPDIDR